MGVTLSKIDEPARDVYTSDIYIHDSRGAQMADSQIATLFRNGGSQAVRLPREFRFSGDHVRVRRYGRGVLLEPLIADPTDWFRALDQLAGEPFMREGRDQPATPARDVFE